MPLRITHAASTTTGHFLFMTRATSHSVMHFSYLQRKLHSMLKWVGLLWAAQPPLKGAPAIVCEVQMDAKEVTQSQSELRRRAAGHRRKWRLATCAASCAAVRKDALHSAHWGVPLPTSPAVAATPGGDDADSIGVCPPPPPPRASLNASVVVGDCGGGCDVYETRSGRPPTDSGALAPTAASDEPADVREPGLARFLRPIPWTARQCLSVFGTCKGWQSDGNASRMVRKRGSAVRDDGQTLRKEANHLPQLATI